MKNECFFTLVFTGKEKDSETGYYAFGARYYDSDLSGLFLSVDPMADKYPRISPFSYCAWNPVRLVDPNGREIGDYYDEYGNYLGWDGNNNNYVFIVGNQSDIRKIKGNDQEGHTTSINDLQSNLMLKTSYGVLRESCNVLDRAKANSNQTKEECSVVDFNSGLGVRSQTGEFLNANLPSTPDWVTDEVSIHSHNIFNDATLMSSHRADNSGDADHFGDYVQNVIVGPIGVGGASGLCFYPRTSTQIKPIYTMRRSVADKIISQQFIRIQREIQK